MPSTMIHYDRDRFIEVLSGLVGDPDHGGVMSAVDVVSSDAHPGELLLVVQDDVTRVWYSNDRRYTDYRGAFTALGAVLDSINARHEPLSDRWSS